VANQRQSVEQMVVINVLGWLVHARVDKNGVCVSGHFTLGWCYVTGVLSP